MSKPISPERIEDLKKLGYEVRMVSACPYRVYLNGTTVGDGKTRAEGSAWQEADWHQKKAAKDARR